MHSFIGIDPGLSTGICLLDYCDNFSFGPVQCFPKLVQCDHASAAHVLHALISRRDLRYAKKAAQIEKFVTGNRAGTKGSEADIVRGLIPDLEGILRSNGYTVVQRPAADVKPWSSDKRLEAAGVPLMKTKLRDAADAARHALYCAVKNGMRDPLA